MANNDVAILILAAGKGTRLKSSLAKVLHHAGGRALVEHVVRSCEPLGAKKTIAVIGYQAEKVAEVVAPYEVETVVQQPQKGTGHALLVAKRAIGNAKYVVVLPGDAPLVRMETLRALIHRHKKGEAAATILTAVLGRSFGLRANSEEIRGHGSGDYRGVAILRGAARTERNQFEHLLLYRGEAVAGAGAGEAQQQTPRNLPDRCHW